MCIVRSKRQILGADSDGKEVGMNLRNRLVSNIHNAKQFNKFTSAKSSRMHNWMSAQTDLVESARNLVTIHDDEEPLIPCSVFRPVCAAQKQLVCCRLTSNGLVKFKLGLVYSVFRGALSKASNEPRKLRVTKNMALNCPAEAVARVMVLFLDKLGPCEYCTGLLNDPMLLVPHQQIVCEVPCERFAERSGMLFFILSKKSEEILSHIEEAKIDAAVLFTDGSNQKKRKNPDEARQPLPPPAGFTVSDFPSGEKGQKAIKAFLSKLPLEYQKHDIHITNKNGCFRMKSKWFVWDSLCSRAAIYFDMTVTDKKSFSNCVYHTLARFLGFPWLIISNYFILFSAYMILHVSHEKI